MEFGAATEISHGSVNDRPPVIHRITLGQSVNLCTCVYTPRALLTFKGNTSNTRIVKPKVKLVWFFKCEKPPRVFIFFLPFFFKPLSLSLSPACNYYIKMSEQRQQQLSCENYTRKMKDELPFFQPNTHERARGWFALMSPAGASFFRPWWLFQDFNPHPHPRSTLVLSE